MSLKHRLILLRREALLRWRSLRRPPIVRHAGVRLAIGPHLSSTLVEAIYSGDYERSELKGIRRHLAPTDTVMELGAGLGFISTWCARRIGAERVHAFEANPALEPRIRETFALNSVSPHLDIALLGETEGEQTFYVERDFWSSSTVRRSESSRPVTVPRRRLNDAIARIRPTFLILDIEGGEDDLLRFIDFQTIRTLAIELHPDVYGPEGVERIRSRLRSAGFHTRLESGGGQCLLLTRDLNEPTQS